MVAERQDAMSRPIPMMPPLIAIAPLQRPAANGRTVHDLRKRMLGGPLPILKVWPALEEDDGVATKLVFVRQFRPDCWRHTVAEPVESSLHATAFQFGYWHLFLLFAGAVNVRLQPGRRMLAPE